MISDHTHSCPDVTDNKGKTPLDIATKGATSFFCDEDKRRRFTEVAEYLRSLSAKHSEFIIVSPSLVSLLTYSLYIR